jgi:alcohol dehydrogenase, propanol-preferring
VAGIHLTDIPSLNYQRHLFQERQLRGVTANTRTDGRRFLTFAEQHQLTVATTPYPLDAATAHSSSWSRTACAAPQCCCRD